MYVIFGKENCPYCVRAKDLLESKGLGYQYRDVSRGDDFNEMNNWVENDTGKFPRTVPQIFKFDGDREYIGGYTELCDTFNKPEEIEIDDFEL
ncbi:glutaredoxin 3 [Salmonella phage SSBI34]|nr:glutaredoxin 3 [Salmonella phage SSBI34]